MTADSAKGRAPLGLFTLKGGDMISNKYVGVDVLHPLIVILKKKSF